MYVIAKIRNRGMCFWVGRTVGGVCFLVSLGEIHSHWPARLAGNGEDICQRGICERDLNDQFKYIVAVYS